MTFEDYFSESSIVKILCRLRAKTAGLRHEQQFFRNISDTEKDPNNRYNEIENYFPKRKDWYRPRFNERKNKNSFQINVLALEKTICHFKKYSLNKNEDWYKNLKEFIDDLLMRITTLEHLHIESPQINLIVKDKTKNTYRPISKYSLSDTVIISLAAKYLRDQFDDLFSDCSYAFRSPRNNRKVRSISHHNAVDDLIQHIKSKGRGRYFVAECDITKFFDIVSHDVALKCFNTAVRQIQNRGSNIDNRAQIIFNKYLESYSFKEIAKAKSDQWFEKNNPNGKLEWAEEQINGFYNDFENERIGVPQGGALSPLIANLVLDKADKEIIKIGGNNLFYARYCDDIILIHNKKRICKKALNRYIGILAKFKLSIHKPEEITHYSDEYYETKSKRVFKWHKGTGSSKSIPWISFLGYNIKYDLTLRIRKTSLEKELKKQQALCNKLRMIIRNSASSVKKNKRQLIFRARQKLISMSVGRVHVGDYGEGNFCWCSGFKLLKHNPFDHKQIERLDQERERQLSKLINELTLIDIKGSGTVRKKNIPKYFGYPFSYLGQFVK